MSPLHNSDWYEDDTDSSDGNDYYSSDDDLEHDLIPDFIAPQELFSVVSRITTQQNVAATAVKRINLPL